MEFHAAPDREDRGLVPSLLRLVEEVVEAQSLPQHLPRREEPSLSRNRKDGEPALLVAADVWGTSFQWVPGSSRVPRVGTDGVSRSWRVFGSFGVGR